MQTKPAQPEVKLAFADLKHPPDGKHQPRIGMAVRTEIKAGDGNEMEILQIMISNSDAAYKMLNRPMKVDDGSNRNVDRNA